MLTLSEFNELFDRHYVPFLKFANSYVRDQLVAEEMVSEAFTLFWEKRNDISTEINRPAYILTIVKNLSLNYLKRLSLKQQITNSMQEAFEWELSTRINTLEVCNPEYVFSKEIKTILFDTIRNLPKKTQQTFILSRMKYQTHKEIANKLNITTKGVEYHIAQATKVLKRNLKDYFPIIIFFLMNFLFID